MANMTELLSALGLVAQSCPSMRSHGLYIQSTIYLYINMYCICIYIFFLFFIFISWRLITLQYYSGFRHIFMGRSIESS